jgi:cation-transporting P-type ATPase 13A2
MALYSMIELASIIIMYGAYTYPSNYECLWVDLFMILPLATMMGYTEPYQKLSKYSPTTKLFSFAVVCSVVGSIFLQIGFQIGLYST